jgi:hypothetical protein
VWGKRSLFCFIGRLLRMLEPPIRPLQLQLEIRDPERDVGRRRVVGAKCDVRDEPGERVVVLRESPEGLLEVREKVIPHAAKGLRGEMVVFKAL